ncbi:MAG: permease [Bacteroidales bacterium]|nr:permease [Bacteroidales bacterium]
MNEIIELINRMSPYILLGFFLAGVMHAFVPNGLYQKYLGTKSFRSVLNAAILGVPIPLCSCGVIPTAMSLRKEGASKGAAVSFLIATPQTGIDSIIATYSLMGLPFALLRPIAALFTALFGGQMVNLTDNDKNETAPSKSKACSSVKSSFKDKVIETFRYAYVEMIQDIGRWLIVGLVVAGLITVFVPESFFALFAGNSLLSMLLVLVFAIPMYLCATGSIPIAVALMMKGLSPGTALVLLMAGPAVNAASMLVVGKVLGKKTLIIYILSITLGAILFGLGIDYLLPPEWFTAPIARMAECSECGPSVFNIICTITLILLLVNAMILRYRHKKNCTEDACIEMEKIFKIEGLRCNRCKENAEKAIASIEGVESVSIDLASGEAVVKGTFDEASMKKAVESLGFKVTIR